MIDAMEVVRTGRDLNPTNAERMDSIPSVQGFRRPISEVLRVNAQFVNPKSKRAEARAWRAGYMSALYAFRANCLPSGYAASDDVRMIQAGVEFAILRLEAEAEVQS